MASIEEVQEAADSVNNYLYKCRAQGLIGDVVMDHVGLSRDQLRECRRLNMVHAIMGALWDRHRASRPLYCTLTGTQFYLFAGEIGRIPIDGRGMSNTFRDLFDRIPLANGTPDVPDDFNLPGYDLPPPPGAPPGAARRLSRDRRK